MTDQEFTQTISNEFGIPLQGLTNIISDLRIWKQLKGEKKDFPSWKRVKEADLCRIIDDPDFKVITIHIETTHDVIHLINEDPLFHFFNRPIKLFQEKFRKDMIQNDKEFSKQINKHNETQIFSYFTSSFRNSSLTLTEQIAVIGKFLVHFEIKYREPIMTYDQWLNNPGSSDGYPDYLYGRLKNRYENYKKKLLT